MLSITHTLISLPIGIYLESPLAIIAASITMHFLADTFLHWNLYPSNFSKRVFIVLAALDVSGGVILAWTFLGQQLFEFPILLAMFAGNLPDVVHTGLEVLPPHWRERSIVIRKFMQWHDGLQLETTRIARGLVWQGVFIALALVAIVNF